MAVAVVPDAACVLRRPQRVYRTRRNPHEISRQTTGDVARHFNLELALSHDDKFVRVVDKVRPDLSRRISEDAEGEFRMISSYRVGRDGNGIRPVPKEIVHPGFPSERQLPEPAAADHRRSRLTSQWPCRPLGSAGVMIVPTLICHDAKGAIPTCLPHRTLRAPGLARGRSRVRVGIG